MKWGELGWGGREGTHEPRRRSRQLCDLSAVPGPVCASISLLLARAADMGPQGEVPPMSPRSAAEQRAGWVPQLPPDFEQGPAPPHLQPRVRGGSNPGRQRGPLSRACQVGRGSRGQLLRSHGVWGHSEQAGPAGSWRGDHANQERRQAEEVVSGGQSRADGEGGRMGHPCGPAGRPGCGSHSELLGDAWMGVGTTGPRELARPCGWDPDSRQRAGSARATLRAQHATSITSLGPAAPLITELLLAPSPGSRAPLSSPIIRLH